MCFNLPAINVCIMTHMVNPILIQPIVLNFFFRVCVCVFFLFFSFFLSPYYDEDSIPFARKRVCHHERATYILVAYY